jgi:hypothetical protein
MERGYKLVAGTWVSLSEGTYPNQIQLVLKFLWTPPLIAYFIHH